MQDTDDDKFLGAMGLKNLSDDDKKEALANILYTLNVNVGMRVADQLSDQQLEEFDRLTEGDYDEQTLTEWLKNNVPNYAQLIGEEAEKMRDQALSITDKVMNAEPGQKAAGEGAPVLQ
ncbi:MAG TPA: DUF5663 domain-containing protein [Candidatus Saccharimonadales bacterium]|nr:DUF5663 domain-containing protein [Candidatus Saccharimonadales bacterium]